MTNSKLHDVLHSKRSRHSICSRDKSKSPLQLNARVTKQRNEGPLSHRAIKDVFPQKCVTEVLDVCMGECFFST